MKKRLFTIHYSLFTNVMKWVRENRKESLILLLILLLGAFLRLYHISEYMTFLGDEGRDAIIVRRLLVNFDPILIGPRTSIGDMYLGPLYYYLIAPSLLLVNFSPIGPSIMVAILGIVTIFLVWYVTREWFSSTLKGRTFQGKAGALIAAFLYTISPVVIIYSRSSWNPNIMPFFSLLSIYSIWRVWNKKDFKWLFVLAVSFAFTLQSHWLGLLLLPTIVLFLFLSFMNLTLNKNLKFKIKNFVKYSFISLGIFGILMSPLVIFDARHDWRNFASMQKFFTERQTTVSARPWSGIPKLPEISKEVGIRLIGGTNKNSQNIIFYFILVSSLWIIITSLHNVLVKKINTIEIKAFTVLYLWLGFGLLGLSLYKQHIYDHYYGFFFTAPFILIGGILSWIFQKKNSVLNITIIIFITIITVINLQNSPLKYHPNRQMQRAIEVAEKIQKEAANEKFNLAVIAEQNYEDGYQYFLEKNHALVYDIDPLDLEKTVANQLFVVCEMEESKCDPTHSAKAEIANFGWSKIDNQWKVSGVILYKLVHSQ